MFAEEKNTNKDVDDATTIALQMVNAQKTLRE